VTFDPVPLCIICVRLGPSTPGVYVRVRALDPRNPGVTVEVLSCIKDWELADQHKQHIVEKETKDLEAVFEAMYLDDEQELSPGSKRKVQEGSKDEQGEGGRNKLELLVLYLCLLFCNNHEHGL
jgi:hypothetical protein